MKILSLQPFLKGSTISPASEESKKALNFLTHILIKEGYEVFVLPWKNEKIWDRSEFIVSDDYSYATALPTLYFPRLTNLFKTTLLSFNQKKAFRNPNKHVWELIKDSFYKKKAFLKKAMKSVEPAIVHVHYSDSTIIHLYRKEKYAAPIVLTHYSKELRKDIPLYDFVVFVNKDRYTEALETYPELKNKSTFINHSADDINRKDFTEKYLQLYREIINTNDYHTTEIS